MFTLYTLNLLNMWYDELLKFGKLCICLGVIIKYLFNKHFKLPGSLYHDNTKVLLHLNFILLNIFFEFF